MSTSNSANTDKIKKVHEAIKILIEELSQTPSGMNTASGAPNGTIEKFYKKNSNPRETNLERFERLAYTPYKWAKASPTGSHHSFEEDEIRKEFIECIERKLNPEKDASKNTDNLKWKENVSEFVEKFWEEICGKLANEFMPFLHLRNSTSRIIGLRSFIKPPGMTYGVKIEDIYQEVPVLYSDQQQKEEEITIKPTEWIAEKLCSRNPTKLIVTGELGSGKTTMLLRIAKRISERIDYIPIFFRFRRYAEAFNKGRTSSIIDFIVEDYFEKKLENDFIENLRLGKIVVMIDGIDEVPNDEKFLLAYSTLTQFIQRFHDTKFVVSCRNQESWQNRNDQDWLNTFDQVIKLDELEEATSFKYMCKFFKNFKAEYTNAEMEKIQLKLKDLLNSNPLILTFVCVSIMSYKKDSNFDNYLDSLQMNKWNLIEICVHRILEEWNQVQDKDSIFWNLSFESKQLYLGNLALKVHETDECFFTWKRLREFTCDFFAGSPNLNPIANIKDNFLVSDKIIDDLEQQQSLFVKKTDTQYGFTNEIIRLWFAATTIRRKYGTFKLYLDKYLKNNFSKAPTERLRDIYYEIYPEEKPKTD